MTAPTPTPAPAAVLFDMDGVVIHSFEAWLICAREAAESWGLPAPSREKMTAIFGQGVEADAESLYPGRTPAEITAMYQERFPRHLDAIVAEPGAAELLAHLAEAGLGTAVVTNTPTALAARVLEAAGLRPRTLVGADPSIAAKPAPDMLIAACERLGVPVAAAIMVGDSRFDHQAARAAGMPFVGFRMPPHDRDPAPAHHVESMVELESLIT